MESEQNSADKTALTKQSPRIFWVETKGNGGVNKIYYFVVRSLPFAMLSVPLVKHDRQFCERFPCSCYFYYMDDYKTFLS